MTRLALLILAVAAAQQRSVSYDSLTQGQTMNGFRTTAVYLNDAERPMGARFIHQRSGFTLDLLEIQSVPQAFIWVTTFPTSDMGEPHTQEHLLLGKGNKGRAVASGQPMSLVTSTAFTQQWRTAYSFYTAAGGNVFLDEFEREMDALLHPDYTDEEVRREVRNFGVTENLKDQSLDLEEKGTVYNEMVSSSDQPGRRLFQMSNAMVYGANHPLSFNSGGSPEALRIIQPSDIRNFHAAHYHLANMGAVIAVPKEMTMSMVLASLDASLNRLEPTRADQPVRSEKDLPQNNPAPAGEIRLVEYPHRNAQQPGSVYYVWPANRDLSVADQVQLELFLENFAGDPATNLYKRLIDSRTRQEDFGPKSVFGYVRTDIGHSVTVGFGDVPVAKMNERDLAAFRAAVLDELKRVAAWKDGSEQLKEFNGRMRSRVIERRRDLAKFVNSPPGFGFRGNGSEWLDQLDLLNKESGFRKSVTMKPVLESVERAIAGEKNVWAQYLAKWKLTDTEPWALAAKPNPDLIRQSEEERAGRMSAELERLKRQYSVEDGQDALRLYRADYDKATGEIDQTASRVSPPKFVDDPPMTLDDQLDYKVSQVAGVQIVSSTFENMTSATTGIALRADVIPQNQLLFLSMLPQLITRVGVIENGKPVSYEQMSERLRKEILSMTADFSTNAKTGRVELVIRGAGNDLNEALKAIDWMELALFHPDWRVENLPRIRDLIDQTLSTLRRTTQTAEENWVQGVANAYWRQDSPLLMATTSFLTQTHNVYRLRWMLKDATPEGRTAGVRLLNELAAAKGSRADYKIRLDALAKNPDRLVQDIASDLDITLVDLPDSSLEADWSRLCHEMANDLMAGPDKTLATLDDVRRQLLKTGGARTFTVSATPTEGKLKPRLQMMLSSLQNAPAVRADYNNDKLVTARLQEREPKAAKPIFVGLLNPNSQSGVFMNSAPAAAFEDTDREKLLDYLAAYLYGGGGGHSIFMKTWGAGLAYSNGLSVRLGSGRLNYYAERTPELPQTLRFVIDELKRAKPDPSLVEYAVAQAFLGTRSASSYESRGEQMAANLADGLPPDVVARFHKEILDLRRTANLSDLLFQRMNAVYARILPGLGAKASEVSEGVYFVIGPEKQFAAWEEYLKNVEGPDTTVYRLYPRDFWM